MHYIWHVAFSVIIFLNGYIYIICVLDLYLATSVQAISSCTETRFSLCDLWEETIDLIKMCVFVCARARWKRSFTKPNEAKPVTQLTPNTYINNNLRNIAASWQTFQFILTVVYYFVLTFTWTLKPEQR